MGVGGHVLDSPLSLPCDRLAPTPCCDHSRLLHISLQYRSTWMSSEAVDRPVATRMRNNAVPYWAFFTKEEAACWNLVDRSREAIQTQEASPQPSERSHQHFSWRKRYQCTDHPKPRAGVWSMALLYILQTEYACDAPDSRTMPRTDDIPRDGQGAHLHLPSLNLLVRFL
jgi:hypothetical protein